MSKFIKLLSILTICILTIANVNAKSITQEKISILEQNIKAYYKDIAILAKNTEAHATAVKMDPALPQSSRNVLLKYNDELTKYTETNIEFCKEVLYLIKFMKSHRIETWRTKYDTFMKKPKKVKQSFIKITKAMDRLQKEIPNIKMTTSQIYNINNLTEFSIALSNSFGQIIPVITDMFSVSVQYENIKNISNDNKIAEKYLLEKNKLPVSKKTFKDLNIMDYMVKQRLKKEKKGNMEAMLRIKKEMTPVQLYYNSLSPWKNPTSRRIKCRRVGDKCGLFSCIRKTSMDREILEELAREPNTPKTGTIRYGKSYTCFRNLKLVRK